MDVLRPEVGLGRGVGADPPAQPLELSLADVRKPLALGAPSGLRVQIDRHGQFPPHALGELGRERHTVVHGDAAHRHERHDVGRSHARMLPSVLREIDARGRHPDRAERGLHRRDGRRHEGEHRTVMRRIRLHVEESHARDGHDGRAQGVQHGLVAALGEVRHAFHQRRRHSLVLRSSRSQ